MSSKIVVSYDACYSSDLECPKGLCGKVLVPKEVLWRSSGTFKRWILMGGPHVTRNMQLKETVGPWPLSLPLVCFLAMK